MRLTKDELVYKVISTDSRLISTSVISALYATLSVDNPSGDVTVIAQQVRKELRKRGAFREGPLLVKKLREVWKSD
jgi:hypothetical protein